MGHRELGLTAEDFCGDPDCYGCQLRGKGIQLSNSVTPSRVKNMRPTPTPRSAENARVIYEDRPGGFKMPLLKSNGDPLRSKEFRENRRTIADTIQRIRTPKGP